MKHLAPICVAIGLAIAGTAVIAHTSTAHYSGHSLAKGAKVTMETAAAIALKARPGKITDRELENEGGGSGLRYSFDIVSDGVTYEVGVDANTGQVLENATEGAHPD